MRLPMPRMMPGPANTCAHSDENTAQHQVFLDAYAGDPAGYADTIGWFKTLPLWLDLGELRVVHACSVYQYLTIIIR